MAKVGHLDDLGRRQLVAGSSGEPFGVVRSLSEFGGLSRLLVHHETLPPQRRASSPHYHTHKEEMFLVLEGTPSVWLDGTLHQLKPGDFVGCPSGEKEAHMLVNHSEQDAVILTIGTQCDEDEVTFVDV